MRGVTGELIDVMLADEFCFDITLFSQLQDGSNLIVLGPQAYRRRVSIQHAEDYGEQLSGFMTTITTSRKENFDDLLKQYRSNNFRD